MVTFRRVFDVIKTPLTLLVLVGLLIFGAWYGYKNVTKPIPSAPPTPCESRDVGAALKVTSVTVNVYNAGTQRGLAGEVAAALKDKGFIIGDVDNAKDRTDKTIIKGARKDNPEVKLVAGFFTQATVEEDNRADHTVDVFVGADWPVGAMKMDAPTQIAVPGKVCLPATKTPTPKTPASAQPTTKKS